VIYFGESLIHLLNNPSWVILYDVVYDGMIGKATPSFYPLLFTDDETSPGPEESKLLQSVSPGE